MNSVVLLIMVISMCETLWISWSVIALREVLSTGRGTFKTPGPGISNQMKHECGSSLWSRVRGIVISVTPIEAACSRP